MKYIFFFSSFFKRFLGKVEWWPQIELSPTEPTAGEFPTFIDPCLLPNVDNDLFVLFENQFDFFLL